MEIRGRTSKQEILNHIVPIASQACLFLAQRGSQRETACSPELLDGCQELALARFSALMGTVRLCLSREERTAGTLARVRRRSVLLPERARLSRGSLLAWTCQQGDLSRQLATKGIAQRMGMTDDARRTLLLPDQARHSRCTVALKHSRAWYVTVMAECCHT